MSILSIFWNLVRSRDTQTDIRAYSKPTIVGDALQEGSVAFEVVTNNPKVPPNCRGILFRSVLSIPPSINAFLDEITLAELRKARQEPDLSLLYKPKKTINKSIGVLRIIRPLRFNENPIGATLETPEGKFVNTTLFKERNLEFEVLLESTEFILEDVQEQMAERFQLQETFGDFNVFFFGKRAEIFTYSGSLLNGEGNLNWRNKFLRDYEENLRGTKAAEKKARAYMLYDDVIREGYILSAGLGQNSMVDGVVKFNFTMLVTNRRILNEPPPSRKGVITLADKGQEGQGITEFRFIRSFDPSVGGDLPGVVTASNDLKTLPSGEVTAEPDADAKPFPFVQDLALPGPQPPDDTKQQLISLSLKALDQIRGAGKISASGATIDHDVIFDFIRDVNLGTTTKLIISGKRSLDVENFKGDELVLLLLEGRLKLDALSLKQAVDVADSLATTSSARVGNDDLVDDLKSLAAFFRTDATDSATNTPPGATPQNVSKAVRISGSPGQPQIPVGPEVDFRSVLNLRKVEGQPAANQPFRYVLQRSADNTPLKTLLDKTKALRSKGPEFGGDLDRTTLDDAAADSVKVKSIGTIAANVISQVTTGIEKQIKISELYAATFLLVKNPTTGNLFTGISQNLPGIGQEKGALETVREARLLDLKKTLGQLPSEVDAEFGSVASLLNASSIVQKISQVTGIPPQDVLLSEAVLGMATGTFKGVPGFGSTFINPQQAKFVNEIAVYISSIVNEQRTPDLTMFLTDMNGGTARALTAPGDPSVYFTSKYNDALDPLGDEDSNQPLVAFTYSGFTDFNTNLSKNTGSGLYLITPFSLMQGDNYLITVFGEVKLTGDDVALAKAGYIKIPDNVRTRISQESDLPAVQVLTKQLVRKTPVKSFSVAKVASPAALPTKFVQPGFGEVRTQADIEIPRFQGTSIAGNTVILEKDDVPAFRVYTRALGNFLPSAHATTFRLDNRLGVVGKEAKEAADFVFNATKQATKLLIANDLVKDSVKLAEVKKVLPMEPIVAKSPEVKAAAEALQFAGINVSNYLDFGTVLGSENEMANRIKSLRDAIEQGLAAVQDDPEDRAQKRRAKSTDENDEELRNTLCGREE